MANTWPDEGERWAQLCMRARTESVSWLELRLFQNDLTILDTTVLADFDEADYSGYAAFDLNNQVSIPVTGIDGHSHMLTTGHIFQHDGGGVANDIYGWYVVDHVLNMVVMARRFDDAPRTMASILDFFMVTINWGAFSAD